MTYSKPSESFSIIDSIKKIDSSNSFDFRKFAYPDDELSYLFEDWVEYYRGKYAICKAIQPKSILEVGVRYGYSAISFLSACPEATYIGIDNDTSTYGGALGAIKWAEKITKDHSARFLIQDTQEMTSFPGEYYDLIHIDGQQDGDGTYHDLEMALEKGRYILVDGYFWTQENMLASTYFLKKYDKFFEFAIIIPGYAGELLIKTKDSVRELYRAMKHQNYKKLRDYYDSHYYLGDCGGYELFSKTNGSQLDERLLAIYYLTNPKPDERILDMGFGRGELACALAQSGASVTAVDYSPAAVGIAQRTYSRQIAELKLEYIQADVCAMEDMGKFQKIIAADIVEHLEDDALHRMMATASRLLNNDGYLVIHTSPNLLNYTHAYARKRKVAKEFGIWLPENPRTFYEDLMHINEQTPEKLAELLKKYFKHVLIWTANGLQDLGSSLINTPTSDKVNNNCSIFAIASNYLLDKEQIYSLISQEKLEIDKIDIQIQCDIKKTTVKAGSLFKIPITLINKGIQRYTSLAPNPVHISYHIQNQEGSMEFFEGKRTALNTPLLPLQSKDILLQVKAPETAGEYILQLTMLQEGCFWFETVLSQFPIYVQLI
ncbi:MAG: methyltransferase domain-containing protein, partial [Christensenellales bacterium]